MGLDVSHDAFSASYSAFNRFRQKICEAMGGSYPPHYLRISDGSILRDKGGFPVCDPSLDEKLWYWGDEYGKDTHPGLYVLLSHSDCDGEIPPDMCAKIADELEALLPVIEKLDNGGDGHILRDGGYTAVTRRFIAGCRAAAANNEPLEFG